jgi:hypothetical protein
MTLQRLGLGVLAGILAAILVLAATRPNAPGISLDGVTYMSAGDALVHTGELRVPYSRWTDADSTAALSHWAPGVPILLAIPHAFGVPILSAARGMLVLSAFLTVLGLVLLTQRVAGTAAAGIVAAVVIASPDLARLHTSVWSEPPFLVCVVALLTAMVLEPDKPLLQGLLASIGVLLRYAGVALAAAAALWALLRPGPWRGRVRGAFVASAPSIVAQLWWSWRTAQESAAIRNFGVNHLGRVMWLQAWDSLRKWLAPARPLPRMLQVVLALAVAFLGVTLLVLAVRRVRASGERVRPAASTPEARLYAAAALLAVCYTIVIVAARLFADRWISFDGRIFSPVILLAETAVVVALGTWWARAARAARVIAAAAVAVWCSAGLTTSAREASEAMRDGLYMTYGYWRYSLLLDWVRHDGQHVPIFTNYPSAVFMYAHRSARETPNLSERTRTREFGATLARTGGVFVAFDMPSVWLLPNEPLARSLALREVARFPDGVVWAASESTPR